MEELKRYGVANSIPNISFATGEILQFFLHISGAKTVFEIGCANGFSTIFLALGVASKKGKVVTCDVSAPSFKAAQENIKIAGLNEVIEFRFGDARTVLDTGEKFDCVFIDGQKNQTHEFFILASKHLTPRGLIILDDTSKFPEKMAAFQQLRTMQREFCFFDIPVDGDDTVTVAFRK